MAEPFFRSAEMVFAPVVAMSGTRITYEGLENIPARGANALLHRVREEYRYPRGEFRVPRPLGGSAPTPDDSSAIRSVELQQRVPEHGNDGVTGPGRTRSGPH